MGHQRHSLHFISEVFQVSQMGWHWPTLRKPDYLVLYQLVTEDNLISRLTRYLSLPPPFLSLSLCGRFDRCGKGFFFSQSALLVLTLTVSVQLSCAMALHALTFVRTLKITSAGSRTFVWTQENTAGTARHWQRCSRGCRVLTQLRRPECPTRD